MRKLGKQRLIKDSMRNFLHPISEAIMRWIQSLITCALATTLLSVSTAEFASAEKFVPKSRGIPGRREGGGTRGACTDKARQLTAIVPQEMGETVSEYPTFSWALPETEATSAEFVLIDPITNEEIYQTSFPVTGQAGIISITLPKDTTIPPLTIDKSYKWQFAVVCDKPENSIESMGDNSHNATEGMIRRVERSTLLKQQLKGTSPEEQAAIYAREGIWFDAAQLYTQLQREQPNNRKIQQAWREFLDSVALNNLSQEALFPFAARSPLREKVEENVETRTSVNLQKAMK
jgi:Domain of Unknown Function (DUF928)